jgi:23S rRNA (cytidine1920-2'-O)/16S rRNA (cytidine1409-2'-O)-methyltransferase
LRKERLDVLLVEKGFCQSRERARASIMAGKVFVNAVKEDKPGVKVYVDSDIELKEDPNPFVSRGGLKLIKAIKEFGISLEGKVALDIGASTGGFTDCMLKNGAKKIYAIDVGYGQLAWELRTDSRVVSMERTNIRYVKPSDIDEKIDFAALDVSFISLTKVLPVVKELLTDNGEIVCLVKPQFEAGREQVGKKGVVRDKEVHKQVVENLAAFSLALGFAVKAVSYSPIKGPEGNIEYLLYLSLAEGMRDSGQVKDAALKAVEESHLELGGKDKKL